MSGIYRKSSASDSSFHGDGLMTTVARNKKLLKKGSDVETVCIEMVEMPVEQYAKELSLPNSEEYSLKNMLAAGQFPELVNCSGMLDSTDPTDPQNVDAADTLLNKLSDALPDDKPAEQIVAPAPANEPAPAAAPVAE